MVARFVLIVMAVLVDGTLVRAILP
jgi:hypothetical protein